MSSLTCLEVDNATWSANNWTNIDNSSVYNEDCGHDDATITFTTTPITTASIGNPYNYTANVTAT